MSECLYWQEKYADAREYFDKALEDFSSDLLLINSPHCWIGMMYEFEHCVKQDYEMMSMHLIYSHG